MAGILTSCNKEIDHPYYINSLNAGEIFYEGEDQRAGRGFAADLCVSAEEGEKNSEGINAEAFALFDEDGKSIISQKNIHQKVYPASTTKIMTCLLALEMCKPDEIVTIPQESAIDVSGSSMADLKPGDKIAMKDLLYGLMVPSGNDAAVAIAMHISGSVDEFARLMNKKAAELGATKTNFVNPHGLPDENHYTTVYDMYLIFRKASENEEFRRIASTSQYSAEVTNADDGSARTVSWESGNGFINGKYQLPEGFEPYAGKTGHTNAAGFCLVLGEDKSGEKDHISIIMKSPVYENLYEGMIRLVSKAEQ